MTSLMEVQIWKQKFIFKINQKISFLEIFYLAFQSIPSLRYWILKVHEIFTPVFSLL